MLDLYILGFFVVFAWNAWRNEDSVRIVFARCILNPLVIPLWILYWAAVFIAAFWDYQFSFGIANKFLWARRRSVNPELEGFAFIIVGFAFVFYREKV